MIALECWHCGERLVDVMAPTIEGTRKGCPKCETLDLVDSAETLFVPVPPPSWAGFAEGIRA